MLRALKLTSAPYRNKFTAKQVCTDDLLVLAVHLTAAAVAFSAWALAEGGRTLGALPYRPVVRPVLF